MLTGIVLTKNEEKNIARCLNGLKFCDHIVVVDDGSTDGTSEFARELIKNNNIDNIDNINNFHLNQPFLNQQSKSIYDNSDYNLNPLLWRIELRQ